MKFKLEVLTAGLLAALVLSGCNGGGAPRRQVMVSGQRAPQGGLEERWVVQGRPGAAAPVVAESQSPVVRPRPTTPLPEGAPPAVSPGVECAEATTGIVKMSKTVPAEVTLGETYSYDIVATALDCAGNIVITDQIPAGASFVRSEPPAEVHGDRLVWQIPTMNDGETRNIKVWVKAEKEGNLVSCATVRADPRVCATTFVGRPAISIDKSGPETAVLGSDVSYNIVVSNTGSAVARNVVVTDQVPAGLTSPTGQSTLTFEVGDLAPNQSRSIPVTLKASQRGRHCNVATVRTSNAGEASDEACTVVLQPGLKIVKTGDADQLLNRNARYRIVVTNTGDTTLTDVVVSDNAPAQTTIVSASGASVTGNQATWNVGTLNPGEEKSFDLVLTSMTAGRHCNVATVSTGQGLRESAEACTVWSGLGAVLLEMIDDPDPIKIGEDTTYTIRVTNQGTADLTNIKTVVQYDAETAPVSSPEGTVSGQTVNFPTVPRLAPKQSFTYTILVRGAREGDSRNRVTIMTDEITRPVVEEESTRVY